MKELTNKFKEEENPKILIVTDGVFSMDGNVASLDKMIALAEKYDAMIMLDESHSAGVVGKTGRGVTELYDAIGKVRL
jgi:glycine C-acetyltransferase